MDTRTLRGALSAALRLPDDQVKPAISKILEANRGRRKTFGRFDSREELEAYVRCTYRSTVANQSDIARQCRVSPATVAGILAKKPVPEPDQVLVHNGLPGLVHHAFRTGIAPSGVLVGVYRYGPRNSYLGYLDSSQVRLI